MSKWVCLLDYISNFSNTVVLLSGGTDSSFLTYACTKAKTNVIAVTFSSMLVPEEELNAASKVARAFGVPHHIIDSDDLNVTEIRQNHPRRCYFCRKHRDELVKSWLKNLAPEKFVVMDGVTASDVGEYRPGLEAAEEDGVLHPLKEVGLEKWEIRRLAQEFGLPFWDKPSSPCLATRFPYFTTLDEDKIARIAEAENCLMSMGLSNVRVRSYHSGMAVVEVALDDMGKAWALKDNIKNALFSVGFSVVAFDLDGHKSGKMDLLMGGIRHDSV